MKERKPRLSAQQRDEIKSRLKDGWTPQKLELLYDVSLQTLYNIKTEMKSEEDSAPPAASEVSPPIVAEVSQPTPERTISHGLTFKFPARPNPAFDFVVGAAKGQREGWFPLGDPSLIGGASGTGKSTLMVDLLEAQHTGKSFLGHETYKFPYLIVMADRGHNAHLRTLTRTGVDVKNTPISFIPMSRGAAAVQAILKCVEERNPLPSVVFVEGCDLLVENVSRMESVTPFMEGLQAIASYYHIAIVGSVGSSKQKGAGYISQRDKVFGSITWSRMCETVAIVQYAEGDDMDNRRILSVLPRNSSPEKYHLIMSNGRLVLDDSASSDDKHIDSVEWFRGQKDRWFTVPEYQNETGASVAKAYRDVNAALSRKVLKAKRKKAKNAVKHRLFAWNEGANNPEKR